MPVKKYDRKNKRFYIIKPELRHIGSIKNNNKIILYNKKRKIELTDEDKIKIYNSVNMIEHLGTEFGAKTILSTSEYDIFKIRDEVKNNIKLLNKIKIKKIKNKINSSSIDIIKNQLGL